MPRPSSPALQPGRRLSSYGRPATALSRLAKLAKTSPGISPGQALPAQSPQYVAKANPPHTSADTGRPPVEDSSNASGIKARGSVYSGLAQDAAQHVKNDTHCTSQQAQQQQQGAIHCMVDQNAAVCNAELGDASRQSQAGVRMLLCEATLRVFVYAEHAQSTGHAACFQRTLLHLSVLSMFAVICLSVCVSVCISVFFLRAVQQQVHTIRRDRHMGTPTDTQRGRRRGGLSVYLSQGPVVCLPNDVYLLHRLYRMDQCAAGSKFCRAVANTAASGQWESEL